MTAFLKTIWRASLLAALAFVAVPAGRASGDDAQSFEAVDARTGKPLWHFNTGQEFSASPMSYAVLDKQYVAIAAGSDIFSFALP